ncbi:hypothetical protein D3C75_977930 [compost metagenome]
MTVPRLCAGKIIRIILVINGSNKPVPKACTNRAINNKLKLGERAAIKVPIIENSKEAVNNCLVVNHCINRADIGTRIPNTSKYPVVSH